MIVNMEIFEKLKAHAFEKWISYSEIGLKSNKSPQTISNYFLGKNQIPLDWLIRRGIRRSGKCKVLISIFGF